MIRKIILIANVGNFVSCKAVGDVEFRRVTLILGENARGKSTLAAVLRSLSTGEADYVLGRRCLGGSGEIAVDILLSDGNAKFVGGRWTRTCPQLYVFDQTFVHDNVYAGDFVEHEHKKNLLSVIVGEAGVQLARSIEDVDRRSREQSKVVLEQKALIEKSMPAGMKIDTFLKLPVDASINAKITSRLSDIAKLKRAQEIASSEQLKVVELPDLPPSLLVVLKTTIDGITREAEGLVRHHLVKHNVTEGWVSEALDTSRESCPFCGQSLSGVELLSAFRGYFSQAYGALKQRVADVELDVQKALGESRVTALSAAVGRNDLLAKFWRPIVGESELGSVDLGVITELREAAVKALGLKRASILEPLTDERELTQAVDRFEDLRRQIGELNSRIAEFNQRIAKAKADTAGKSLTEVEQELAVFRATDARHAEPLTSACDTYASAIRTKKDLDTEKERLKAALDAHVSATFIDHHARVNQLLEDFGATFRITRPTRKYTGGSPSAAYGLLINNVEVDLGDRDVPENAPSFRNTLSSSDRSTLALAFFLSSCDQDSSIEEKIVVLDDPFTSQDRTRQWHTQQRIIRLGQRAKQVIVLSHHPQFLKPITDFVDAGALRTLQLMRVGNATSVAAWNPDEAGDQFLQEYRRLTRFIEEGAATADEKRSVARSIRPLVEGRAKLLCPFEFAGCQQFGDVLAMIRDAPDTSPAAQLKPILADLDALNSFARRYMHENPNADTEHIDDGELLDHVRKAVKLAQGLPA